ncbi:MAG: hypothetical protein JNM69_12675 [Archangium sp.]|nr:hypothetical protein [Archangium sp.]
MKLFGKNVTAKKLLDVVKERLSARGLLPPSEDAGLEHDVEAPVEAFAFAVESMSEHVDTTRGLPIETHRDGLQGRAVVLAKQTFRKVGQLFINEALARQVVFNGHVLDGYSQLSAEVMRLRSRVAELESELERATTPAKAPVLEVPSVKTAKPAAAKPKPAKPRKPRAR